MPKLRRRGRGADDDTPPRHVVLTVRDLADEPLERVRERLRAMGIAIEVGPVAKVGARAPLLSIYVRDPDGNLIEIANEVAS